MTSLSAPTRAVPRIACLGVGWIGRNRLQGLLEEDLVEVVAIVDPDPVAARAAAAMAGGAQVLPSLDALGAGDVDGVMIASPSALHAEQSIAALRRGFAVMCQKPLGRDASEVDAVLSAARAADRRLGVDLSYRHVAGVAQMRERVQAGELGELFAVEATFHNAYGPDKAWFYDVQQAGGGCLVDLGTHLVDLVLWVCGASTAAVVDACCFAGGKPLTGRHAVEDYARARLRLPSGAVASVTCSWNLHAGQDALIALELYGTAGALTLRNVGGSFYDFRVEHHLGTSSTVIAEPPDGWGPRAAEAWARALHRDPGYDPEIEGVAEVARILDAVYGAPMSPAAASRRAS